VRREAPPSAVAQGFDQRILHPMAESTTPWPHAPTHRLAEHGTYIVTAGTFRKEHHFRDAARLEVLQRGLLKLANQYRWQIEAWAVFSNHYHFVAHSPTDASDARDLSTMLSELHEKTATWANRLDKTPGRKVWHNFWETRLTQQTSYFARLHYVHHNPVRHGLAKTANQYPWCSAGWFEQTASPAQVKTIYRFGLERVNVTDDFEPVADR
jgi:putative transposase